MTNPAKIWSTKFDYALPSYPHIDHASKAAAYRYVADQARIWVTGVLLSPQLSVYVDERDGQGWQLYERLNLAELAEQQKVLDKG